MQIKDYNAQRDKNITLIFDSLVEAGRAETRPAFCKLSAKEFLDEELAKYETWEDFLLRSGDSARPLFDFDTEPEFRSVKGKGVGRNTLVKFLGENWTKSLQRDGKTLEKSPESYKTWEKATAGGFANGIFDPKIGISNPCALDNLFFRNILSSLHPLGNFAQWYFWGELKKSKNFIALSKNIQRLAENRVKVPARPAFCLISAGLFEMSQQIQADSGREVNGNYNIDL